MGIQNQNSDIDELQSHLGILDSKIRIRILKYLAENSNGVDFKNIHREIATFSSENANLSFHLNKLRDFKYISKTDQGYQLTSFGQRCYNQLEKLSEIVLENAPIKIRTSRYTLEPFNEKIIAQRLMEEANVPVLIADEIAQKAKKRLLKSKITYLTSPLIREFINAILIESHYEDFRHKLTRLGVPPYDIIQILKSQTLEDSEELRWRLGKKTLEQFVLLNNLSQRSADGYLSGKFIMTDLEHFGFSPLELCISGDTFWNVLDNFYPHHDLCIINSSNLDTDINQLSSTDFNKMIRHFFGLVRPFFSKGLMIFRFDQFIEHYLSKYSQKNLEELLLDNFSFQDNGWSINLGISLQANYTDINPLLDFYSNSLKYPPEKWTTLPHLQIHFTKTAYQDLLHLSSSPRKNPVLEKIIDLVFTHQVSTDQSLGKEQPGGEQIITNLGIPICIPKPDIQIPGMVVEKISLNIFEIYQDLKSEAKYSEKLLFTELENALFSIFNYYEEKFALLSKNMHNFRNWSKISHLLFNNIDPFHKWTDLSEYKGQIPLYNAISLHGLDELVYAESGFFIKELKNSREFAVKIYDFIEKLLKKQNQNQNSSITFVLSESHNQEDLINPKLDILSDMYKGSSGITSKCYTGYQLGFYSNEGPWCIENIQNIYEDLAKMKFPYLSASINLDEAEPELPLQSKIHIVQDLFKVGICNISFTRKLKNYRRYHQKYFPET